MKVDIGHCTSCSAKNSKFVEQCYKCGARLPWAPGYQAPPPVAPKNVAVPAPQKLPAAQPQPPLKPAYSPAPYQPAPSQQLPQPATTPNAFQPQPVYPAPLQPQMQPQAPVPFGPPRPAPIGPLICPSCGYSGQAKSYSEGSSVLGILLCLLWLLPGIIYFVWQSTTKYEGCPNCRARDMAPLHSPQGHYATQQFYGV